MHKFGICNPKTYIYFGLLVLELCMHNFGMGNLEVNYYFFVYFRFHNPKMIVCICFFSIMEEGVWFHYEYHGFIIKVLNILWRGLVLLLENGDSEAQGKPKKHNGRLRLGRTFHLLAMVEQNMSLVKAEGRVGLLSLFHNTSMKFLNGTP